MYRVQHIHEAEAAMRAVLCLQKLQALTKYMDLDSSPDLELCAPDQHYSYCFEARNFVVHQDEGSLSSEYAHHCCNADMHPR